MDPSYSQGSWFEQNNSTLPGVAFIQVFGGFFVKWFLRRTFLKIFSIYSNVKTKPQLWPYLTPVDHDFNELESYVIIIAVLKCVTEIYVDSILIFQNYHIMNWIRQCVTSNYLQCISF